MQSPKVVHKTKVILNYVHFDYWEPMRVPSLGGARYFLSIINDYSKMTYVFTMKQKFEAFKFFKHWTIFMKNETKKTRKYLRIDNCLKFCSIEFNELCRDKGMAR